VLFTFPQKDGAAESAATLLGDGMVARNLPQRGSTFYHALLSRSGFVSGHTITQTPPFLQAVMQPFNPANYQVTD